MLWLTECKLLFECFAFYILTSGLKRISQKICRVSIYNSSKCACVLYICHHTVRTKVFLKSNSGMQTPSTVLDRARNRSSWATSNTQWIFVPIQKSVLKGMFLWTCSSLGKAIFKHLSSNSVSVQTVEAYFKHRPWNRIWILVFYCPCRTQVILFLQTEKRFI